MRISTFKAVALAVSLGAVSAVASPWALFASFNSGSGIVSGGARYSLSSDICFDASLGGPQGHKGASANGVVVYADAFFVGQTLGIQGVMESLGGADPVFTAGLAYALEKPITEKIVLGVSPTLVSKRFEAGQGVHILSYWNVYTVIGF